MQDEKTLQQMTREYETEMPQEIMAVITAFDWKKELREVVRENNLMLDVGSDLEQSVYLMILGAVKVDAVYERLVETHEMPEEKAQKVLYEIESRIFNQLSERLAKVDGGEDTEPETESLTGAVKISRDSILAEIETDVEIERPANNIVMPGGRTLPPASMEKVSVMPGMGGQPPVAMTELVSAGTAEPQADTTTAQSQPLSDRLGLRDIPVVSPANMPKPFTMSDSNAVEVGKAAVTEGVTGSTMVNPIPIPPAPVSSAAMQSGIQADPVASGLSAPTATVAPQAQQAPRPIARATDPYREPIE